MPGPTVACSPATLRMRLHSPDGKRRTPSINTEREGPGEAAGARDALVRYDISSLSAVYAGRHEVPLGSPSCLAATDLR